MSTTLRIPLRFRAWLVVLAALALVLGTRGARAQPLPVLPITEEMNGVRLGKYIAVLEDETGKLTIDDLASPAVQKRFAPSKVPVPSFGYTHSVYWVRLDVDNDSYSTRDWDLEVAFPHVDRIDLYVPEEEGGYEHRVAGDMQPFGVRDLAYRNVVFRLREGTGLSRYYLRFQSTGSMTLPLIAWTPEELFDSLNTELPVLWMFYGLMIVMVIYNVFIFFAVRLREYLFYSLYIACFVLFQMCLNGHASQYLFPNLPDVANRALPVSIGMAFFWASYFHRAYLSLDTMMPRANVWLRRSSYVVAAIAVFAVFGPFSISIRLTTLFGIYITLFMLVSALILVVRKYRPAQLYTLAWGVFHVGIVLFGLRSTALVPNTFVTTWSIQIGACFEVLLLSFALADRFNIMRSSLAELNARLTNNVDVLTAALDKAEAGARAKTNFLAMVSHELRTPLNAIINVPQHMMEDFPAVAAASCSACGAVFELEPGEEFVTACPECGSGESLRHQKVRQYVGDPDGSVEHLGFIERSGRHLLQVVSGILDFSKLEAGKLELETTDVDLQVLVAETLGPLQQLASRKGVRLQASPVPRAMIYCDKVRLSQILINLIGNAIKFSDGPGTVSLDIEDVGSHFTFAVSDEGIGIPAEHRERIFGSFEQVSRGKLRRYGGTGLGLTISRALVELHGGRIWAEGRNGPGSVFKFELPKMVQPITSTRNRSFWEELSRRPSRPVRTSSFPHGAS